MRIGPIDLAKPSQLKKMNLGSFTADNLQEWPEGFIFLPKGFTKTIICTLVQIKIFVSLLLLVQGSHKWI